MAAVVEEAMLEHLSHFEATLDRVESKVDDLINRAHSIDSEMGAVVRHFAHLAKARVSRQVTIDHIRVRLERIERRLEPVG